jgi:hypothetical protein
MRLDKGLKYLNGSRKKVLFGSMVESWRQAGDDFEEIEHFGQTLNWANDTFKCVSLRIAKE